MALLDENGINLQTIEQITSENTSLWTEKTGDVDVAPSSAAGELIAIESEMDLRNQQDIADSYTQNTISGATDQFLDYIAEIKNQTRKQNQKSVAYVTFEGVDGTVVPINTIFVCSLNDEEFLTDYEVTISSSVAYASVTSVNNAVECIAESLALSSEISGITSATNLTDATVGYDSERDTSLRARLQEIGSPFTNNLKEGLYLALTETDNVAKVKILDNNTDSAIDGVTARHFSCVVLGGNRAEVANVIYRFMGIGNPTFGDIQQKVKNQYTGDIYAVNFYEPSEVLVEVDVTLSTNSDFNTDTGYDIVKNAIIDYFNNLKIGETLLIQKVQALCLIQGVNSATVLLNGSGVSLFPTFRQLYITNLSNVVVA